MCIFQSRRELVLPLLTRGASESLHRWASITTSRSERLIDSPNPLNHRDPLINHILRATKLFQGFLWHGKGHCHGICCFTSNEWYMLPTINYSACCHRRIAVWILHIYPTHCAVRFGRTGLCSSISENGFNHRRPQPDGIYIMRLSKRLEISVFKHGNIHFRIGVRKLVKLLFLVYYY